MGKRAQILCIPRATDASTAPSLGAMRAGEQGQRGTASVEQAGLVALVSSLLLVAIAGVAASEEIDPGSGPAGTIARRLVCAPRLPGACRHHPLVPAYGWPLARLARALVPVAAARSGPSGLPLVPVDFRRCRRESCAVPLPGKGAAHTTASGRRTTAFTQVDDRRATLGWVQLTYWLYRPRLGWERVVRRAGRAAVEAASHVRVLLEDDPALVPLETLPGRDHYEFPAGERPPWQWRLESRYPGWSS